MLATVIEEHGDLRRTVWVFFWSDSLGVVLDSWQDQERETKRHKFRSSYLTRWDRLEHRYNFAEEPTPPESVKKKALDILRSKIKFR